MQPSTLSRPDPEEDTTGGGLLAEAPGDGLPEFYEDTFGQALWDCYHDDGEFSLLPQIVELSDGHLAVGRLSRYFEKEGSWGECDQWAMDRGRGRVLDVGAGAGRHTLYLASRGFDVTALDPSPLAGKLCEMRGATQVVTASLAEAAQMGERYDTLLFLGNNLGLLGSAAKAPGVFASMRALLTEDGQILGTCRNPYANVSEYDRSYQHKNLAQGRLGGQMTMRVRHKRYVGPWFEYLFCSVDELSEMAEQSRFQITEVLEVGDTYAVRMTSH